jgi:RNA polymerase sigma factor (TIGR02999 family)
MGESSGSAATTLLAAMARGDTKARDQLVELLYAELRAQAGRMVGGQAAQGTLNATALVDEACMKLFGGSASWRDRGHFLAAASTAMRHVLIDHVRRRKRQKRDGVVEYVPLDEIVDAYEARAVDLEALDVALRKMAEFNPEMARAVELRFFGGVTVDEAASVLGLSRRTFERRWETARAWLWRELS